MIRIPVRRPVRAVALGFTVAVAAGCHHAAPPAAGIAPCETVSIGYGVQALGEVTGAVASASRQDLGEVREGRVEELLRGRFAGVDVIRLPNGDYSIRIRGTRSFTSSNEPLVVVDGIPSPQGLHNPLSDLAPQNITRIDVLKDAGATAPYGGRGANGVILVTTKRGCS